MPDGINLPAYLAASCKPQHKLVQYPYIYVAPTASCGMGLFTARPLEPGDIAVRVRDANYLKEVVSYDEARARGFGHTDIFQVGLDRFLLPYGGLDDFTNHSCEPNCGLRVYADGFDMIALRRIGVNEELTYDYSTHQEHPLEDMDCRCGTPSCRGVIRSFSTLPVALRQHYSRLDVVANFVTS